MCKLRSRLRTAVLAAVSLGVGGPAAAQREARDEPKIVVEQRTVDLGRMREGEKAGGTFVLENGGTADLYIEAVRASCGCTVPRKLTDDERRVKPGESLEIEVVFDSKGRRGRQRKGITVTSNDPIEPRLQLFLTAEVVTLFEMLVRDRPARRLTFGSLHAGEEVADTIDLLPTEPGQTLEVTSLEIRNPSLLLSTEALRKDDRVGIRAKLRVDADAVIGQVTTTLAISGQVGDQTAVSSLSISGTVIGALSFRPAMIKQLQPVPRGQALAPVKVSSHNREPFEIVRAEAGPAIETAVERTGPSEYTIRCLIPNTAPAGPFGTTLEIWTDVVNQPVIRIPVFGSVRPLVEVRPARVLLRADGGAQAQRMVKLESTLHETLELGPIVVDGPFLRARVVETPGRKSRGIKHVLIEVTGDPPAGEHVGVVKIRTNVDRQPEIEIPVTVLGG